jgi:hypothetical protein
MSVGDLIGRAIRYYRVNITSFIHVLMWPTIISIGGKISMQWGLTILARKQYDIWPAAVASIFVGLLISFAASFILTLRSLAFVRLANGFATNFKDAYKHVRDKMGTVLGLIVVGHLMIAGVMGLCFAEIIAAALMFKPGSSLVYVMAVAMLLGIGAVILSAMLYWLIGFVVLSAAACEDTTLGSLVSRGFALTFNDFWRAQLFAVIIFVTVSCLSYTLSIPAVALSTFEMIRHGVSTTVGDPSKMPMYVLVVTQAWESLVNMLLWPITWLSFGQFYYDLRVRQEGLDLLQNLKLLGQPAAP